MTWCMCGLATTNTDGNYTSTVHSIGIQHKAMVANNIMCLKVSGIPVCSCTVVLFEYRKGKYLHFVVLPCK